MARSHRIVVPGVPHHVIQRGNRRNVVFFSDDDKRLYLDILKYESRRHGLDIWSYCLMDNHVHLVVVPHGTESLARGIGGAHRKYTAMINHTCNWGGYLWQGRFVSYPMDEYHTFRAIRYIERNPIRAALVKRPEDYKWSSARSHVLGMEDDLLSPFWLTNAQIDWNVYLHSETTDEDQNLFQRHERSGQPLGDKEFLDKLEKYCGQESHKMGNAMS